MKFNQLIEESGKPKGPVNPMGKMQGVDTKMKQALARLGLEVVKVQGDEYTCRPKVERDVILNRVKGLLKHGFRCWQEWLLVRDKLAIAIIVCTTDVSAPVNKIIQIAEETMVYPEKVPLASLAGRNPRSSFNPKAGKGQTKQGGAHPCVIGM